MKIMVSVLLILSAITGVSLAVNPQATLQISGAVTGSIVLELYADKAPITAANFINYVQSDYYNGLIFHRVMYNFMIQGGGFDSELVQKATSPPIINESIDSPSNLRGTVAMARTSHTHSATSQFFINHKDNTFLNYTGPDKPGYAVFGRVIKGMEVVDAIAGVKTTSRKGMSNVPVEPVVIKSAGVISGQAK